MDTDEAWESFIGIRKSNKGYADTIAAALNDIKTDTANLAKLTNQLLGDQQLLENSPGESPAADLGGAPAAMPGSDEMPQDAEADNVNALDDAMSVIDEQVGGGQAPAGEDAGGAPEGSAAPEAEDETAMEQEPAPEAPMPDGGMEPEGMVPQPEASFDTECVQFMDLAKKELQNVTGAGDYYKARRLIGIITDIEKIINSDDDPDTILKGEEEPAEGDENMAESANAAPVGAADIAKSESCGEYESAEPMPQTDRGSSEGGRRGMAMPDVDMEKGDDDKEIPVRGTYGMAESEDAEPIAESGEAVTETTETETIAESEDAEPIAESCGSEPVKKAVMPDVLPSFSDMLAHRKGAEGEDVYVSFVKSANAALQREVDEHFETMGFTKSADEADISKSIDPETGEDAIPPEARRTPVGRDIAVLQNKEGDLYDTRHARTAVTDRDLAEDGDEYYDEFADDQPLTPEQSKKAVDVLYASKDPATRAIHQRVADPRGKFGVQRLSTDEDTGYAELYKSADEEADEETDEIGYEPRERDNADEEEDAYQSDYDEFMYRHGRSDPEEVLAAAGKGSIPPDRTKLDRGQKILLDNMVRNVKVTPTARADHAGSYPTENSRLNPYARYTDKEMYHPLATNEGDEFVGQEAPVMMKSAAMPEALPSFSDMMAHRRGGGEDPYVSFAKSVKDAFEDFQKSNEPAANAGEPSVSIAKRKHKGEKIRWTPEQKAERDERKELEQAEAPKKPASSGFPETPEEKAQGKRQHEEYGARPNYNIRVDRHLGDKAFNADSHVSDNQGITGATYGDVDSQKLRDAAEKAGVSSFLQPKTDESPAPAESGSAAAPPASGKGSPAASGGGSAGSAAQGASTNTGTAGGRRGRTSAKPAEESSGTVRRKGDTVVIPASGDPIENYGTAEERAKAAADSDKDLDELAAAKDMEDAEKLAVIAKFVRKKLNLPADGILNDEQQEMFDKELDQILSDHEKAGKLYDPKLVERLRNQKTVNHDVFREGGGARTTSPRGDPSKVHAVDRSVLDYTGGKGRKRNEGDIPLTVSADQLKGTSYYTPFSQTTEEDQAKLEQQRQATQEDRQAKDARMVEDDYERQARQENPQRLQDNGKHMYVGPNATKDFVRDIADNADDPEYVSRATEAYRDSPAYKEKMTWDAFKGLKGQIPNKVFRELGRPLMDAYYDNKEKRDRGEGPSTPIQTGKKPAPAAEPVGQPAEQPAEQPAAQPDKQEPFYPAYQKRSTPAPYNTFDRFLYDFDRYGDDPDYAKKAVKGLMASSFYPQMSRDRMNRLPEGAKRIIAELETAKKKARESISESAGSAAMVKSASPLAPFADLMAKYRRLRA